MGNKIGANEFKKSLAALQEMAKSQLYHTPSDSSVTNWAGSEHTDQDEWARGDKINIDVNGTDYNGVKKALARKVEKSQALTPAEVAIAKGQNPLALIGEKVSKGQALTPAEEWAMKGGYKNFMDSDEDGVAKGKSKPGAAGTPGENYDATHVPDTHGGEDNDDEIEADAKKSFRGSVDSREDVQKGLELSPFLAQFAAAVGDGLDGMEARLNKSMTGSIERLEQRVASLEGNVSKSQNNQGEFYKALAEAVNGIGQYVAGEVDTNNYQNQMPVGPPMSQQSAYAPQMQKSIGPGGLVMDMDKAQVVDVMTEMVQKSVSGVTPHDVLKFESSNEITPAVQNAVLAYAKAR